MTKAILALSAETCMTIQAAELASTVDGKPAAMLSAPLGDRVSFPGVDESVAEQGATSVQLTAAVLTMRYPWMNFDGLYRFIIAADRRAVIDANAHHLNRLRFDLEDLKSRSGAFAFPTEHGIVVVMPVQVLTYAFAASSETERQYGLTTIWHELAHVYDLTLHYLGEQAQGLIPSSSSRPSIRLSTRQVWHEYFADCHSHWPGFAVKFELELVERALNDVVHLKSVEHVRALAVRLGSAHGRLTAEGVSLGAVRQEAMASLDSLGAGHHWEACARALDEALETVTRTGRAPNLEGLDAALQGFEAAVTTSL